MQAILAGYVMEPARITLEVQENKRFPDISAARESLETLRAMGIRIALDDVGNGYSSIMRPGRGRRLSSAGTIPGIAH